MGASNTLKRFSSCNSRISGKAGLFPSDSKRNSRTSGLVVPKPDIPFHWDSSAVAFCSLLSRNQCTVTFSPGLCFAMAEERSSGLLIADSLIRVMISPSFNPIFSAALSLVTADTLAPFSSLLVPTPSIARLSSLRKNMLFPLLLKVIAPPREPRVMDSDSTSLRLFSITFTSSSLYSSIGLPLMLTLSPLISTTILSFLSPLRVIVICCTSFFSFVFSFTFSSGCANIIAGESKASTRTGSIVLNRFIRIICFYFLTTSSFVDQI